MLQESNTVVPVVIQTIENGREDGVQIRLMETDEKTLLPVYKTTRATI
jgi:hypothetical protein